MGDNGIFEKMVDEAVRKLAEDGIEAADPKDVSLVSYGLMTRNFSEKLDGLGILLAEKIDSIKKPAYFIAGSVMIGVLTFIITEIISLV